MIIIKENVTFAKGNSMGKAGEDLRFICETHKCPISISGCMARQKRAKQASGAWYGNMMMAYTRGPRGRAIPYDPKCYKCKQGKKVIKAYDAGDFTDIRRWDGSYTIHRGSFKVEDVLGRNTG
jgi:hypothetical protein